MNQRWRDGRDRYRPPDEVIDTRNYEVCEIEGDTLPKQFIADHHYIGSYCNARFRFGLFRQCELVGVAVFGHPTNDRTLTNVFGHPARASVVLSRFVLLDDVPGNGETWFLGRCFEVLRKTDLRGVLSMSDPVPRTNVSGETVFLGHFGTIYQAHNGEYIGRATPRTLAVLPDGRVLDDRLISKIRNREQGWKYGVETLVRYGAPVPDDDLAGWLGVWMPRLTRPLRHPGNFRYKWDFRTRRPLVLISSYPKRKELR
jgi:hypothetical protein